MRCPRPCARRSRTRSRPCRRSSRAILERMPKADKKRRAELSELNEEVAKHAVDDALDELIAAFSDVAQVSDYLAAAGRDLTRNVGLFLMSGEEEQNAIVRAAGRHRARCPLPPLPGQRHGLQRRLWWRARAGRRTGRRGAQPHLRQPHRPHRAHRPDGHARHRFPADQAWRPARGQRRLSAARRAQAAAVAVRLGGAQARAQGPRDPHRAALGGDRASA